MSLLIKCETCVKISKRHAKTALVSRRPVPVGSVSSLVGQATLLESITKKWDMAIKRRRRTIKNVSSVENMDASPGNAAARTQTTKTRTSRAQR